MSRSSRKNIPARAYPSMLDSRAEDVPVVDFKFIILNIVGTFNNKLDSRIAVLTPLAIKSLRHLKEYEGS